MVRSDVKNSRSRPSAVFNYSYVVLGILLLLTIGSTLAYYQNSAAFSDDSGTRWTPVVFLIGVCVSLVIFGMTHREASARLRLHQKTLDLIEAERQNRALLKAEQESRIAAEQANKSKDEFLAVVSHELKTPLNAIAGWSRILKMSDVSDEARETALDKIDKNLRIQTSIVEELLSFSDVMSSGVDIPEKNVRMREVFEGAVEEVRVTAFQKGITLAHDDLLDGEIVLGDPARLKIALVNVLDNAIKFTPQNGHVEAQAFESAGAVTCVIRDDGVGIAPEFLPHVFDCYKQSEHVATRHFGGLGLGLAIAQQIVRLHGGTIEAASDGLGAGATFKISLPSSPVIAH